jgi:23S rRNA (cytosine1962-C5)-methyltransferase
MHQIILRQLQSYELLDSGNGQKLERFGEYVLSRPDPNAIWNKRLSETEWKKADAAFIGKNDSSSSLRGTKQSQRTMGLPRSARNDSTVVGWQNKRVREPWKFTYEQLTLLLKLTPFKHTGLFPEQIENWMWSGELLRSRKSPKILNLFGYTGGATLHAAAQGAQVTHVDASKPAMIWAHENQEASGLTQAPVRWITDDALAFVQREVRRGNKYNAIILDPPAFGRSPKGKVFKFEKDMHPLLAAVKQLLSPDPLFVLVNSYATGLSAESIKNLIADYIPGLPAQTGSYEYGELSISESRNINISKCRILPCSQYVRVVY